MTLPNPPESFQSLLNPQQQSGSFVPDNVNSGTAPGWNKQDYLDGLKRPGSGFGGFMSGLGEGILHPIHATEQNLHDNGQTGAGSHWGRMAGALVDDAGLAIGASEGPAIVRGVASRLGLIGSSGAHAAEAGGVADEALAEGEKLASPVAKTGLKFFARSFGNNLLNEGAKALNSMGNPATWEQGINANLSNKQFKVI